MLPTTHHEEVFALYATCKGDGIEPPVRVIARGSIVEDEVSVRFRSVLFVGGSSLFSGGVGSTVGRG